MPEFQPPKLFSVARVSRGFSHYQKLPGKKTVLAKLTQKKTQVGQSYGEKNSSCVKMRKNQGPKLFSAGRIFWETFSYGRSFAEIFELPKLAGKFFWANKTCAEKNPAHKKLREKKPVLRQVTRNFFRSGGTCAEKNPPYAKLPGKKHGQTKLTRKISWVGRYGGV